MIDQLERFIEEITFEYYLNLAGLKDELNISSIYSKYKLFNDASAIIELKHKTMQARGEERRRLDYLHSYLASNYLENATKELTDRIATKEAMAMISIDGDVIPFRKAELLMANEPDYFKRNAIYQATMPLILELNILLRKKLEQIHILARELGFIDYIHMCSYIKKLNFTALFEAVENILKSTEGIYEKEFERIAEEELGLDLGAIRKPDMLRVLRLKSFNEFFRGRDMLAVLKDTSRDLGFDLDRVILDVEKREKKVLRAFCAPVRIPEKVILVITPKNGQDDYQALLHEFGHAIFYSNVNPELPFEFKYLGDSALSEGYAFLFHYLIANRYWLEKHFEFNEDITRSFLKKIYFIKLYMLRRYAGKLRYEYELHSGASEPEKIYSKLMQEALKFEHSPSEYIRDVDQAFYSASYLKAWFFESQLKRVLIEEFGEQWFMRPEAGDFLRELFKLGQKYSAEEVLQGLGFYGLNECNAIEEIIAALEGL
ncbi:MAG: hypothetical protein QXJ68_01890 [Methanocellales archaeon]